MVSKGVDSCRAFLFWGQLGTGYSPLPAACLLPPATCHLRPMSSIHARHQGALAELEFALRAAALGLRVARPVCDTAAYDFVVDSGRALSRVQVKSVSVGHAGRYHLGCGSGSSSKRPYTRRQIDLLAAYIVPEDTWFLIPVEAFTPRRTIHLCPHNPHHRFARYREAWDLLCT